jgi:uncharacterized protein YjiS (DUF1127 family)
MSTIIQNTSGVMASLGYGFVVWLHRANSRNELRNFSDRDLRDIGLSRSEAMREAVRPFWMA